MEQAVAYSTLALTVSLAVSRPRFGVGGLRMTPGAAALIGVVVLLSTGILTWDDLMMSALVQWRPLLALTSIMVMTGVVQEVGAFERVADAIEAHARRTSPARAFGLVYLLSAVTPMLLNNDAAILLLTPLVVSLSRRLYPGRPEMTVAFAFAVFLAPGVAPFVISNPMNMIVAGFAGIGFNEYARVMVPVSIVCSVLTFSVLRVHYRRLFASAQPTVGEALRAQVSKRVGATESAVRPAVALILVVFGAYPVMAALGGPIWSVSLGGALASLLIAAKYRVARPRTLLRHVSPDILVFLWGIFLVVVGLRHVGVADRLAALYQVPAPDSLGQIAVVGTAAALGSAVVDNHPMSILNMMALGSEGGSTPILAALIGGDIGPRLLPIGSLAGLLWMSLLRRSGVEIGIGAFVRLGTLVLIPTLAASLLLLWSLT